MELKRLRNLTKKTQEEVAKDLNLQKQTYQNYELEKRQPDIDTLIRLSDYYHVTIDELVGHKLPYLINKNLSQEKRQLIEMIKTLTEEETLIALGWVAKLTNKPIEEVMKKIK